MSERPVPSPLRPLADVLDELRLHDDLEEMEAMDPAELEELLADPGYDPARVRARVTAALEGALPPLEAVQPPPAGRSPRVVSLDAARARRAATTRWAPFAAAAAILLGLGTGGEQYAAHWMPARTVLYPAESRPPTPEQLAGPWKRAGLRACAAGYYAECEDLLDEARKLDPQSEQSPDVKAAREAIEVEASRKPSAHPKELNSKPPVAPGERRLQPGH